MERVVLPVAMASSAAVGLIRVTGGDVGSTARLDTIGSVPREGTSLVSSGGWVVLGLMRTGVGDKTVPGSLVGREEEDAAIPVMLGPAPKSIVPLAMSAVFAVRRLGAVSVVVGTELGLETTGELSAMVVVTATAMEAGAGDSAAARVDEEDDASPVGPMDTGWPRAGVERAASLEPGASGVPSEGKGGLVRVKGNAVESSPSPYGEDGAGVSWVDPGVGLGCDTAHGIPMFCHPWECWR